MEIRPMATRPTVTRKVRKSNWIGPEDVELYESSKKEASIQNGKRE
jgi:hypothetical protein